jgi:hypothetical protein
LDKTRDQILLLVDLFGPDILPQKEEDSPGMNSGFEITEKSLSSHGWVKFDDSLWGLFKYRDERSFEYYSFVYNTKEKNLSYTDEKSRISLQIEDDFLYLLSAVEIIRLGRRHYIERQR